MTSTRVRYALSLLTLLVSAVPALAQQAPKLPPWEGCFTCASSMACRRTWIGARSCVVNCAPSGYCLCALLDQCLLGTEVFFPDAFSLSTAPKDPLNPRPDLETPPAEAVAVQKQVGAYFSRQVASKLAACWPYSDKIATLWFTHEYRQTSKGTWTYVQSDVPMSEAPRDVVEAAKKCMAAAERGGSFTLSGFETPSGILTVMWPWGVGARK